jgi:hypothetical protein
MSAKFMNIMQKIKSYFLELLYLIIGLTFLLLLSRSWLPADRLIIGHDSGLPLDSVSFFISRLSAWNPNVGFGMDNSHLFGSLTLHFVDYLSSFITGKMYAGNWFNVFFWLSSLFVAAFVLGLELKKVLGKYFVYLFPPLIVINFYIAQSLFILERAKYSVLVAILIFLTIVIKLLQNKLGILKASALTAIVFLFFNGGSLLAISLYGNLLIPVLGIILFFLIYGLGIKNFSYLFKFIKYIFLTLVLLIILNLYQILPYITGILNQSYLDYLGGTISDNRNWLDYISRNTSILNLLRLEGVPNWYSNLYTASREHSYAAKYVENAVYIFVSFLIPILSFFSLILAKNKEQKRLLLLFSFIALCAIFFAAGSHTPFGEIYIFLYTKVPGFFVFRNPYYKFAGAVVISISILLAASISLISTRLVKHKIPPFLLVAFFIGTWCIYHWDLFSGEKIFAWKNEMTTRSTLPGYVEAFKDWNDKENVSKERILLYPPLNKTDYADGYKWGYWSLSPITYNLLSIPGLINEADLTGEEMSWLDSIYQAIKVKDKSGLSIISSELGIKYILLRKDVTDWDKYKEDEEKINSLSSLTKIKDFGNWIVYKIDNGSHRIIEPVSRLALVSNDSIYLAQSLFLGENIISKSTNELEPFIDRVARTYDCQSCLLENIQTRANLVPVSVFPNSPLYFLTERRERKEIASQVDDTNRIFTYLSYAARRTFENKSMIILNIEDRFIQKGLLSTNNYLDLTLATLRKHPELSTNYFVAKRVLDTIYPLLDELHKFVLSDDLGKKSSEVGQLMYKQIELMDQFDDYFTILKDYNILRDNKIFQIPSREKVLYLDSFLLSKDDQGRYNLPTNILYEEGNLHKNLQLEKVDDRWYKILLPSPNAAGFNLTLKFNPQNIFVAEKNELVSFPSGPRGCVIGNILNYTNVKSYETYVATDNKAQQLGLFFRSTDNNGNRNQDTGIAVYPIEARVPFRYVYTPERKDENVQVLLCTEDKDFPDIKELAIYEMISPKLEGVEEKGIDNNQGNLPTVTYTQTSPTRYIVDIKNATGPFILRFNQRYALLWSLYSQESGAIVDNHFNIDGYANGWKINPQADSESTFILEYSPQRLFISGMIITVTVFSVISSGIILTIIKNKWRKK